VTALILSFGGRGEAVCAALHWIVRGRPIRILVLHEAQEHELDYQAFDAGLNDALESFVNGNVRSVQFFGDESRKLFGGAFCPRFSGGALEDWSGYVEGLTIEDTSFDELRSIDGLSYVALSIEESPDLDFPHVTNETFPWSDWRLVAGAVLAEDGQWSVRHTALEPRSS
jgi:hypothetical protein